MKATLWTSALAFCTLSAFAAGPQTATQQQNTTTDTAATAATATPAQQQTTTQAAPAQASSQDSPLVAAAKRTGRLGKTPGNVITNDTLLKSGGHFTTTKSQDPLPTKSSTAGAAAAANGAASASNAPLTTNNAPKAGEAKKADDSKAKTAKQATAVKRAAAAYEGDSVESPTDDPATQEGVMASGGGGATKPGEAPKPAAPRPPSE